MHVNSRIKVRTGYKTTMNMPIAHVLEARVLEVVGQANNGQKVLKIEVLRTTNGNSAKCRDTTSFKEERTMTCAADATDYFGLDEYFRQPKFVGEGTIMRVFANRFEEVRHTFINGESPIRTKQYGNSNYNSVAGPSLGGFKRPAIDDKILILALS